MAKWQDFDYKKWKDEDSKFDHEKLKEELKQHSANAKSFDDLISFKSEIGSPPFKPQVFYNKYGDQIEVYLSDSASYSQWLCPGISVKLDMETNEIIGLTIESVKHIIKEGEIDA